MGAGELLAVLPPLVRASVEGALLALLVGGLCRLRPAPSAALGREQARLGERQREAGERAERELRALVDKAIAAGAAAPAR